MNSNNCEISKLFCFKNRVVISFLGATLRFLIVSLGFTWIYHYTRENYVWVLSDFGTYEFVALGYFLGAMFNLCVIGWLAKWIKSSLLSKSESR
tara:strand:+ start:529 stop:810 length:282 start_codon:yes stop_codon:yes gene_type:complete